MKPRLQVTAGPLADSTYFLTEAEIRIGRDPSNSLAISDLSLSRRHCLLGQGKDGYRIRDLDSRNGTFVNGEVVSEQTLNHGDQISVGDSVFVFLVKEDTDEAIMRAVEFDDHITQATAQIRPQDVLYLQPERILKELPATSRLGRNLNALLKISRVVHSISNLDQLQAQILALIFEAVPAERGAILLDGQGNEKFSSRFVHPPASNRGEPLRVSRTITRQVMEQGVAILGADVPGSGGLSEVKSLVNFNVRSLLCVPLTVFQKVIGCIYLDTTTSSARFDKDHLELVASMAEISAVALENARRLLWLEQENLRLAAEINLQHNMVGEGSLMKDVYRFLSRVAPTDSTVLVSGESGTGKELVARAIHRNSPRANRPFVAINCAAIPEGLLESELFGYERGAFTGATAQKKGRLEMADGGVVFLDEIGELAPALQVKLLRVLQEREFERLGGSRPIAVDIRLIAATNKDLAAAVKTKTFREDLYYRLDVVSVVVPPLRERREDIPILAEYFVTKFAAKCKVKAKRISAEAMAGLMNYDWPGNVRELENAIERALVLGVSDAIRPEDLPESILEKDPAPGAEEAKYHMAVKQLKKHLILTALEDAKGNYTEAARTLGVHANYLHRLVRNLDLRTSIRSLSIPHSGTGRTLDGRV
ncbi:MAG: sigma 54-interacting transcriptional regulator [Terriglobales bacterium]